MSTIDCLEPFLSDVGLIRQIAPGLYTALPDDESGSI